MNKIRAMSRSSTKDSNSTSSSSGADKANHLSHDTYNSIFKRISTAESKGELSPELSPIVTLLSAQAHRRYNEGVFMLLRDLDSDGNPSERKWNEVYGVLTGNQLAIWDAELLENLPDSSYAKELENKPTYINFTDASVKAVDVLASTNGDLTNVIVVSTTLKNRFLIQINSKEQFQRWHAAFRLAAFEYKCLQEAYTAALLSARGSMLSDIRVILAETKFEHEDWTSVRFGAGMPWKRCFAVIEPSQRKKKKFSHGKVCFYENEKKVKKLAMATLVDANSVYAIYPENYTVIDHSTLIKMDGEVAFDHKSAAKNCSIFLMPEQHSSVPGYDTLIRFIIPLMDSFQLYGRPVRLNADKKDPNSLLFALPVLPQVHYMEVDDILQLTTSATTVSWIPSQWNSAIKDILRVKLAKGYQGCGSLDGITGATSALSASRELASGKTKRLNSTSPTFTPNARFVNNLRSSSSLGSKDSTSSNIDQRLDLSNATTAQIPKITTTDSNSINGSLTRNGNRESEYRSSMSPRLLNIYKKYSELPNDLTDLSLDTNANGKTNNNVDELFPGTDDADDAADLYGAPDGSNGTAALAVPANGNKKDRVLSPFTDFNESFNKSMYADNDHQSQLYGRALQPRDDIVNTNELSVSKQRNQAPSPLRFNDHSLRQQPGGLQTDGSMASGQSKYYDAGSPEDLFPTGASPPKKVPTEKDLPTLPPMDYEQKGYMLPKNGDQHYYQPQRRAASPSEKNEETYNNPYSPTTGKRNEFPDPVKSRSQDGTQAPVHQQHQQQQQPPHPPQHQQQQPPRLQRKPPQGMPRRQSGSKPPSPTEGRPPPQPYGYYGPQNSAQYYPQQYPPPAQEYYNNPYNHTAVPQQPYPPQGYGYGYGYPQQPYPPQGYGYGYPQQPYPVQPPPPQGHGRQRGNSAAGQHRGPPPALAPAPAQPQASGFKSKTSNPYAIASVAGAASKPAKNPYAN